MNKAEILFMDKASMRGGIYLYPKTVAIQFILECKKQGITILGIDGFFITENTTQPSIEHSIDYSRHPFTEGIYDEAIQFLEIKDDKMYFEIVCPE